MYELTVKQKLTNYYYFVIFNSLFAMLISSRYLVDTLNYQINLDISTSVFLIINHITYILIISLFISLFGLLFVEFMQMDITKDKLPNADLMIVRDALGALSYDDIKLFLTNFYTSNIKYLLVSTHNKEKSYFTNKDVITGEFRSINLFDKPFNFNKTKVKLTIIDSQGNGREMILLSKEDVPKTF